jgi:hypothetical protein
MIRLVIFVLSTCLLFSCASGPQICECKHWDEHVGDELTIEGKVAEAIWQHMMTGVPGKTEVYVDLDDKTQTVAYIEPAFNCKGKIRLTGIVVEVRGGSKRPGSKIDDKEYVEYHLDVSRWECLD